jgi:hypothetical protein
VFAGPRVAIVLISDHPYYGIRRSTHRKNTVLLDIDMSFIFLIFTARSGRMMGIILTGCTPQPRHSRINSEASG